MGWEESLFGKVFQYFRRRTARRDEASRPNGIALTEELRARWLVLGSAVAGIRIEVQEAEVPPGATEGSIATTHGGTAGSTLRLPGTFWLSDSAEENEQALLFRVLYGSTAIRLRMGLTVTGSGEDGRALGTLLAVPATLDSLQRDFEGAGKLYQRLCATLLAQRPTLERLQGPELALELLTQARLGRPFAEFGEVPASVQGWLDAALRERPATASELQESLARTQKFVSGASCAGVPLWGSILPEGTAVGASSIASDDLSGGSAGTERRAKPRDQVRRVVLGNQEEQENPLVHSFEKVHTIEEHRGGNKRADESDEMNDHADALDDANIREVVRSRTPAKSVYRADISFETENTRKEGDETPTEIPYHEWDGRSRRYRENWCSVRVDAAPPMLPAREAAAIRKSVLHRERANVERLKARFEQLSEARLLTPRQLDGPELDLDALVDRHGSQRAGRTGGERLYVARRTPAPDTAVLVLLDSSLSTDSWVQGRRVMDVAKETLLVLGEALEPVGTQVYVGAFFSNTRRDCRWLELKPFHGEWQEARRRLLALQPTGYTRIGPAIRHGTKQLESVLARRKLLLLVSDGKPTDYDHYEGQHGLQDVKQAVREATQQGISTLALAIDAQPRVYLPQMFGLNGYKTILHPRDLTPAMEHVLSSWLG
ncbi:MAG: VWA domain-containing protein [Polyangiaceae bacterium]